MKALAVVTESLYEKIDTENKCLFPLDNYRVPLAFVDISMPEFDPEDKHFSDKVLVKKASFSLNYRDLALIEAAWHNIASRKHDSYYAIGSDFGGYVEAVGKDVVSLKKGDSVLGNCSYPFGEMGATPGIPSNHSSKEYEVFQAGKLIKAPAYVSAVEAGAMNIGVQTANSMVRKAKIREGDNVLITSITSNTSFFILNALWEKNCNVYGLSYSGKNSERVKKHFPFIKEIYNFEPFSVPQEIQFDVVFDAFSDTYLEYLIRNLNYDARYLTCGIFNQTIYRNQMQNPSNLSVLITQIIAKNIRLIGSCLGNSEDLKEGLKIFKKHKMVISRAFTKEDSLGKFVSMSYNLENDKFGKVVYKY